MASKASGVRFFRDVRSAKKLSVKSFPFAISAVAIFSCQAAGLSRSIGKIPVKGIQEKQS
jgi:hypothetical protein